MKNLDPLSSGYHQNLCRVFPPGPAHGGGGYPPPSLTRGEGGDPLLKNELVGGRGGTPLPPFRIRAIGSPAKTPREIHGYDEGTGRGVIPSGPGTGGEVTPHLLSQGGRGGGPLLKNEWVGGRGVPPPPPFS